MSSIKSLLIASLIVFSGSCFAAITEFRLASQLPDKHALGENLHLFANEVERLSHGQMKIKIYPASQLYSDKEMPKAIAVGAVDMGIISLTQFAGTIPAVDLFYLPFLFDNQDAVLAAIAPQSPVRIPLDEAMRKTGTRVMWWQPYGSTVIMSHTAIRTPKDLAGKKVRVFGKTVGEFITAVGAGPTLLSGAEQYLAYQRGTVDAGLSGILAIKSRKLYQLMPSITLTRHADVEFVSLINEQRWNDLSTEQQSILTQAARIAENQLRHDIPRLEREAEEFVAAQPNTTVIELSKEERDSWRVASAPVRQQFLQRTGKLGEQLLTAVDKVNQQIREQQDAN
ncbi:TRAP transporter substrate-binding protein DctP [Pseudomonas sp. F1_0610]|uniref:TRAP transporter substrate-binding protein DctP n=1 Tax=Pseudomonas sp. F1_0610 TaxID=3114284 RepID=UPI0039C40ECC